MAGAKILSYAIAVYDYAATSTSQVTLKLGDRIAVLSKNGQDKGWWKGENLRTKKVSRWLREFFRDLRQLFQ
nr:hypothetical protein BaRGS_011431 [Batillaria attramentaria]